MARFKVVEQFNSQFTLDSEAQMTLFSLLKQEVFLNQIAEQVGGSGVEFTELLFQPVPYTPAEPKGMPTAYEAYYDSPDYVIINVPPNFMNKARIFQPSRLCAIYKKV